MKPEIFLYLIIALSFAACDNTVLKEADEEYARLNDIYHLKKVEFYLDGNDDGLSVTETAGKTRTFSNKGNMEIIVGFKSEDVFSSVFYFEEGDQPYTLAIDTAQKIEVPRLLENDVLYMRLDELWSFRNEEPEERLTGAFQEHSWNLAPMCQTVVNHTVRTSTITASFNAYFEGENTHSEVIVQGKWVGRETEHINYDIVTDEIK